MSVHDQTNNLDSELLLLQSVFDKCVAEGDVPGFTRAKAKIKKLEALRQQAVHAKADIAAQSMPGIESPHHEVIAREIAHTAAKPAQSLAMLLLQSLENNALTDSQTTGPEFGSLDKSNGDALIKKEVVYDAANAPQRESIAEGLVDELVKLAQAVTDEQSADEQSADEQSADDQSVMTETQIDLVDTVQPLEFSEVPAAVVLPELAEPGKGNSKISKSGLPANSAKKELAKFWKFITKPEAFMEDQDAQNPLRELHKSSEPES